MNSTTTLVAKQCRLETWAKQIQDCNQRPQGMSVKDWCSQLEDEVYRRYAFTLIISFLSVFQIIIVCIRTGIYLITSFYKYIGIYTRIYDYCYHFCPLHCLTYIYMVILNKEVII